MTVSRRQALLGMGLLSLAEPRISALASPTRSRTLPVKDEFRVPGIFLNAAYVHPVSSVVAQSLKDYAQRRFANPDHDWPFDNARDEAVAAFAGLVNASPTDVAVVPSTMVGENMLVAALRLGPRRGVVTDALHYAPSLALYGELRKHGVPVTVVAPRDGQVHLSDLRDAIRPDTRLLSLSLVSSSTGFAHDLKAVCDLAHAQGVLVYADIIQAAGAIPIDLAASGVDFCCCGGYKWLQGDFGAAFLYARRESQIHLTRPEVGWRQIDVFHSHVHPGDPPGDPGGEWEFKQGVSSLFEVASPSHPTLWCLKRSIDYLMGLGVDAMTAHRTPMLERLQQEVPKLGFKRLTPNASPAPMAVFWKSGITERLAPRLAANGVYVSISRDRMRVAPSVFNDMRDIDTFLEAISE